MKKEDLKTKAGKVMVTIMAVIILLMPVVTLAGDLEPSSPPGPTMHTLEEIYNLLYEVKAQTDANAANVKQVSCEVKNYRFCDMGNGSVKDMNSGLIWLKDANAMGSANWGDAKTAAATLSDGEHGLTDGSSEGDWRLPTKEEWAAFVDTSYGNPALCNAAGDAKWTKGDAFTDVQPDFYWSSTEYDTASAWYVDLNLGYAGDSYKLNDYYVWPVRSDN